MLDNYDSIINHTCRWETFLISFHRMEVYTHQIVCCKPAFQASVGANGVNTLRLRQNGRRFADDTFRCIFLNKNVRISIEISLKFVPKGPINNILALVQIMIWRRSGDKPLSEAMMVSLLTHICVTRPQWVNEIMARTVWDQILL